VIFDQQKLVDKLTAIAGHNEMYKFRIDVTFEMRTVLNGIRLLIGDTKLTDNIFKSKHDGGEESRIAERQIECVRERQRITEKRR
jgi:hypothetical protein